MKALVLLLLAAVLYCTGECAVTPSFSPLYRYVKNNKHYYTTDLTKIGTAIPGHKGKYSYKSEGIACILLTTSTENTVPLYRYLKSYDYLYTTNSSEIGTTTKGAIGTNGYRYYGITGYCYPVQVSNTLPLYRYKNPTVGDHLYTTDANEIGVVTLGHTGKNGYIYEGITCFVYKYAGMHATYASRRSMNVIA